MNLNSCSSPVLGPLPTRVWERSIIPKLYLPDLISFYQTCKKASEVSKAQLEVFRQDYRAIVELLDELQGPYTTGKIVPSLSLHVKEIDCEQNSRVLYVLWNRSLFSKNDQLRMTGDTRREISEDIQNHLSTTNQGSTKPALKALSISQSPLCDNPKHEQYLAKIEFDSDELGSQFIQAVEDRWSPHTLHVLSSNLLFRARRCALAVGRAAGFKADYIVSDMNPVPPPAVCDCDNIYLGNEERDISPFLHSSMVYPNVSYMPIADAERYDRRLKELLRKGDPNGPLLQFSGWAAGHIVEETFLMVNNSWSFILNIGDSD